MVTPFATTYLSSQRLHKKKGNLRKLFTLDEWSKNRLPKEAKEREATKNYLCLHFGIM